MRVSMISLYQRSHGSSNGHAPKLLPGTYEASVKAVDDSEDYFPGEAFTIVYNVTTVGGCVDYRETFINDSDEPRTADLLSDMESAGINDVNDLPGHPVELVLKKQRFSTPDKPRTFLNVYARTFA